MAYTAIVRRGDAIVARVPLDGSNGYSGMRPAREEPVKARQSSKKKGRGIPAAGFTHRRYGGGRPAKSIRVAVDVRFL